MAKILICGDSFSCSGDNTWVDMLASDHQIVNMSTAGASEYRIWLQYQQVRNLSCDKMIVVHTSANRIYCERNFFHDLQGRHKNCDLIYADIASRSDPAAEKVRWWFENVFDINQANFYHDLLLRHWIDISQAQSCIHITFFDYQIPGLISLYDIWQANQGSHNHMSVAGNNRVLGEILRLINTI